MNQLGPGRHYPPHLREAYRASARTALIFFSVVLSLALVADILVATFDIRRGHSISWPVSSGLVALLGLAALPRMWRRRMAPYKSAVEPPPQPDTEQSPGDSPTPNRQQ